MINIVHDFGAFILYSYSDKLAFITYLVNYSAPVHFSVYT